MGSIFGGQSSSQGGGLQGSMQGPGPRNYAGDQADAFDSDPYRDAKDLYSWKQQQDLDMQNKREFQNEALSTAPQDPYKQAMTAARAAADAESYMSGQKIADAERTRQDLYYRNLPENWYGQYTGSSAPTFAHMLPAYQMHGIDVMGGRGTGWDQYAKLATGTPTPNVAAQSQANALDQNAQLTDQQIQQNIAMKQYPGMFPAAKE